MNFLDLIFLVPFCLFLIQGFRKGLVVEVFSIIAFIIALIGSLYLTDEILQHFVSETSSALWPYIFYVIVFAVLFFFVLLVAKLIEKVLKLAKLNMFNRIAGALLGTFKAILIASLIYWITDKANIIGNTQKESSFFFFKIKGFAPVIITFLTDNLHLAKDVIRDIESYFNVLSDKI